MTPSSSFFIFYVIYGRIYEKKLNILEEIAEDNCRDESWENLKSFAQKKLKKNLL